jgi:hypothetical protein
MLECCCRTIAIHAMLQLVVTSTIAALARPSGEVTLNRGRRAEVTVGFGAREI